jgi:hypothetical protein
MTPRVSGGWVCRSDDAPASVPLPPPVQGAAVPLDDTGARFLMPRPSGPETQGSALTHVEQQLALWEQLLLVLLLAAFILYPGLANAALSVFACYQIDTQDTGDTNGVVSCSALGSACQSLQLLCTGMYKLYKPT